MIEAQAAFQISTEDNVATALTALTPGIVDLRGDTVRSNVDVTEDIPVGHKVALRNIQEGEDILKYGVVIGRATQNISEGKWVHLHCIQSLYDQRSSHLDVVTGAPKDIKYE